ncbi:unnamed protein product [Adineta steineri]|uniref:EF-hand domain-containing protein n=1 Tax=Adineta steineri TaxID=433720 RepID=A0A819G5D2_9BILA|nr:unnamed protein product [Adineta steineri]CAF3876470.1 unnamed protein product [Adineta steineri]
MGNRIVTKFGKSKSLTDEEIVLIQKISKLSADEIREEHKGFMKLQPTGKMTKRQFINMYNLLDFDCDMTDKVACKFDISGDGYLDHEEVTGIFDGAIALNLVQDADPDYARKTASEIKKSFTMFPSRSFTIVSTIITNIESNLFREQSEHHADNLQKETILVTYLNDISNLLMLEYQSKISCINSY